MSDNRTFPTTAAERYDRALRKSLKMKPPPAELAIPAFTSEWPKENVALLESYRDWLVTIGASTGVINQHRLPMAGHVLGLNLRLHDQLTLTSDFDKALTFIEARQHGERWQRNCHHSLNWFRRFVKEQRGMVVFDNRSYGDASRYQEGLPKWLIQQLTKFLHIRQANWRPSRLAQASYQFWYKETRIWRWLFANTDIQQPQEITRDHLFRYIDEQLVAGYKVASINHDLHTFQGTLRFLRQQGLAVPQQLISLSGLKKPQSLPRFLTDGQVLAVRDYLDEQVAQAKTIAATRDAQLDRAAFTLLWQTGMRVSELEDLCLEDVDVQSGNLLIREAKGVKDRAGYLTRPARKALEQYLAVRGPALTDHLFIYRHKPLSKDLVRNRLKAVGKKLGFKMTPHMLRHTFATQLLNAGASITTIQALLGHRRLNTTMTYARVHDQTVMDDYFQAMAQIEGVPQQPKAADALTLLDELQQDTLTDQQKQLLEELRRYLT